MPRKSGAMQRACAARPLDGAAPLEAIERKAMQQQHLGPRALRDVGDVTVTRARETPQCREPCRVERWCARCDRRAHGTTCERARGQPAARSAEELAAIETLHIDSEPVVAAYRCRIL